MGVLIEAVDSPVFGKLWVVRHPHSYTGRRPLDPGFTFTAWER